MLRVETITKFKTTDGEEFEDYAEAEKHQEILDKANEIIDLVLKKSDVIAYSYQRGDIFDWLTEGDNLEQIKNILNKDINYTIK